MTPSPDRADSPHHRAKVVLGVAGGIAAYKSVELLRLLKASGAEVRVVLTPDATRFVGALTFSALSDARVRTSLFDDPGTPIPHTELGQWADVIVVAPATAHVIARLATGLGDDLLTATVLASTAPLVLCPAMHTEMWRQPSVQGHLSTLRARGALVLDPGTGPLAGGDEGPGRVREPAEIAAFVDRLITRGRELQGRRVLVSAGGTREPIDPVRVITNRSSGRQGHAVAEAAARRGADVTLVTASALALAPDAAPHIERVGVTTAAEMADEMLSRAGRADVIVMAAAVSDFTVDAAHHKLKRADGAPELHLRPTEDILAGLGELKHDRQVLVGFAAETDHAVARAKEKRRRKGCDLLVVNDVTAPGAGFDHPTNEVTIIDRDDRAHAVSLRSKEEVAAAILDNVIRYLPGE